LFDLLDYGAHGADHGCDNQLPIIPPVQRNSSLGRGIETLDEALGLVAE